jgi:hypothetical protein
LLREQRTQKRTPMWIQTIEKKLRAMPLAPTNETKKSNLHELFWLEKHLNQQEIELIKLD